MIKSTKAYRFLRAQVFKEPLVIQAIVLRFLANQPSAETVTRSLAHNLLLHVDTLLEHGGLQEVCIVLDALAAYDTSLLSGEIWARLLKRLVKAECAIGGPYAENNRLLLTTNMAINSLLCSIGSPLPRVKTYTKTALSNCSFESVALAVFKTRNHLRDVFTHDIVAVAIQLAASKRPSVNTLATRKAATVLRATRRALQDLPEPLRMHALAMIDELARADNNHEITLINYYFQQSLVPKNLSAQLWRQLGVANVLYWLAYTTYDNFLDDEGVPERLSVANTCMRRSVAYFQQTQTSVVARRHIIRVFDVLDAANAWELQHCRANIQDGRLSFAQLPTYILWLLSERSYVHALGPMLLLRLTQGVTEIEKHTVERAWRHFLIARQLSDDIYDWHDDVTKGRLSYVVTDMLQKLQIMPGSYDVVWLKNHLQQYFWQTGLEQYANIIIEHIAHAKQLFHTVPSVVLKPELWRIIEHLELSAQATVRHQHEERQFLQALYANSFKI